MPGDAARRFGTRRIRRAPAWHIADGHALASAWRDPEGLAFTPRGRAIVALDTRKPRRNLVVLGPVIAVAGEVSPR